ncbi:MAG TPA: alpha/beta hydrolase [Baekduia sp.]|uniref:alpha/beta fold hydrolase n=1 Tax=Baekduia sp. TaxID=2600305 RepID=UPI002BD0615F|nr:alpha/beta hydrolase [Baekduia sp.]HMJ33514.1 alpha/beta hydrolase [Baekduia sp.]
MSVPSVGEDARADLAGIDAQSTYVQRDGVRLHVLDYGGDRRPLIVLPGITSPAVTWDFVVRELRDLVRPVVLDCRGRGLSDTGPSYAVAEYAADVEATVAALGLDAPLLLGHSMGARIASYAAASSSVPFGASIIVDPPLSGPGRGGYPTPRAAFLEQLHEGQRGTNADEVQRFYPRWPRPELEVRARWVASCDEHAVLESLRLFSEVEDFFTWWPAVPAPTALIYGGASPVVTADGVREAAAANPAATVHEVRGAGHMVPWDELDAFMAVVRPLLAAHV